MDIHPIHTEADYKATLKEISALMESDPDLGTPEGDRLDILATLVQAYEAKHVPITAPDPVEAIKFRMDQSGLSVKDLEPIIGKSNRVSAQHWTAILGDVERVPRAVIHPPKAKGDPQPSDTAEPELHYVSCKEIVKLTLPCR